jgi:U3 small nucleolar RNA-associated protein 18
MEVTAFSPTTGDILAVGGRGNYVHLVDWKSGGQVVGSLKCGGMGGGTGGGVKAMWWIPPNREGVLGDDGGQGQDCLAVMTGDAEVYLWDVGQRRCVRRWRDEGGFRGAGRVMAGSTAGAGGGRLGVGYVPGSFSVSWSLLTIQILCFCHLHLRKDRIQAW